MGYLQKSGPHAALMFSSGEKGSEGDIGNPSWSPDGRRVVYQQGPIATTAAPRAPGEVLAGSDPDYELVYASGFPAVSPDGRRLVVSERTGRGRPDDRAALAVWNTDGTDPRRIFRAEGSVLAPQWSFDGEWIVFGVGNYFLARTRPAHLMMVRADGSGGRVLTTGEGNAGFPSFSPDGTEVVYRFWSDKAGGLRVVTLADGKVRTLTTGYDNFPVWSPQGDRIVFSRLADDDFDIYTMRPDGSGVTRLTTSPGNDSHPAWSADGDAHPVQQLALRLQGRGADGRHSAAVRRAVHHERRRLGAAGADRQPLGGRHAGVAAGVAEKIGAVRIRTCPTWRPRPRRGPR